MDLTVKPLTPDLWPAFADLFDTGGPVGRCWCMFWRIGGSYNDREPEANRDDFHQIVEQGPPPGLLAFAGDQAVGWCQITPRDDLDWLDGFPKLKRVDETPVWSISCFYVRKGWRKQGVSTALIEAAVDAAHAAGAPAVEAYPLDPQHTTSTSFTGFLSTFERAGFEVVARHAPAHPIVRYPLEG